MKKKNEVSFSMIEITERLRDDSMFRPMSLFKERDLIEPENKIMPCEKNKVIGVMDFFEQRLYSLIKVKTRALKNPDLAEKIIGWELSFEEGVKIAGPNLEEDVGSLQEIMTLQYLLVIMIRRRLGLFPLDDLDFREGFKILSAGPEINCQKCGRFCSKNFSAENVEKLN